MTKVDLTILVVNQCMRQPSNAFLGNRRVLSRWLHCFLLLCRCLLMINFRLPSWSGLVRIQAQWWPNRQFFDHLGCLWQLACFGPRVQRPFTRESSCRGGSVREQFVKESRVFLVLRSMGRSVQRFSSLCSLKRLAGCLEVVSIGRLNVGEFWSAVSGLWLDPESHLLSTLKLKSVRENVLLVSDPCDGALIGTPLTLGVTA